MTDVVCSNPNEPDPAILATIPVQIQCTRAAITAFVSEMLSSSTPDHDHITTVVDLMTGLLHLVRAMGDDPEATVAEARWRFEADEAGLLDPGDAARWSPADAEAGQ